MLILNQIVCGDWRLLRCFAVKHGITGACVGL